MKPKILFLVGPTASGKSALAVSLAKKLGCRIISCDSMQIYKGMEILTSVPTQRELAAVRHYLVAAIPPTKDFDVSQYRRKAMAAVRDILKAKKTPLFVGGSGLYMSVVVDGIFKDKAGNEKVRRKLEKQAARLGSANLHERLAKVDPDAAKKIHPNDAKRIIRALEVYEVTGKPISQMQRTRKGLGDKFDVRMFCLDLPRPLLYKRINERVDAMFGEGLVDEVKCLLRRKLGRTAACAIGLGEVKGYLHGDYTLETAREVMKRNTRAYAKRQLTWFRKDKRLVWVDGRSKEKALKKIITGTCKKGTGNSAI